MTTTEPPTIRAHLARPGARALTAFGLLGRAPISMLGLSVLVLAEAATGSYGVAGAASGAAALATAVAAPLGGRLVDRFGVRRTATTLVVVFAIGCAGVVLAGDHVTGLLVCTAVAGATVPNVGALSRARWSAVLDRLGNQVAQTVETLSDEALFAVGPPLVTLLATLWAPSVPLVATVTASLVGTLGLVWVLERLRPGDAARTPAPAPMPSGPAPRLLPGGAVSFLGTLVAYGAVLNTVAVLVIALAERHGRPGLAGVVLGVNAVVSMAAGALVAPRLAGGDPRARLTWVALAVVAVNAPLALGPGTGWLAVGAIVPGLATAPLLILANDWVAQVTPPSRRTEGFAWVASAAGVGGAIGAAVSGAAVEALGATGAQPWLLALAALPGLLALAGHRRGTTTRVPPSPSPGSLTQ